MEEQSNWGPQNYNPDISVSKWVEMLNDPAIFKPHDLEMIKRISDYGKPFLCKELTEKYGEDENFYSRTALWKRIAERCNITDLPTEDRSAYYEGKAYYSVMFYRDLDSVRSRYKLREEVLEAVKKVDLSNVFLYVPVLSTVSAKSEWIDRIKNGYIPFIPDNDTPKASVDIILILCGDTCFIGKICGEPPRKNTIDGETLYEHHFRILETIKTEKSDFLYSRGNIRRVSLSNVGKRNKGELELIRKSTGYSPEDFLGLIRNSNDSDLERSKPIIKTEEKQMVDNNVHLNTILYGPPGTGKTYSTVKYAVSICDPEFARIHENYKDFLKRFNELKKEGRIAFTTFHQSYGYEEFIEGIKPVMSDEETSDDNDSGVEYSIESGIFKRFCEKASIPSMVNGKDYGFNENPTVWKVSLKNTYDNEVRSECLAQGHIRIGWDEYGPDITDEKKYESGGRISLNAFINRMQVGDIVFSCYTQSTVDAIGVITGDYEWDDSYPEYKRVRKVDWIVKKNIDVRKINGGRNMVQSTVYRMSISASDVIQLINNELPSGTVTNTSNEDKYVFIIDEINRGNISKIMGELITLIEDNKRIGNEEEMRAELPYSHKEFGVPNNVYILGTMNTADRSIALMDTALRRRFHFEEMMPNSDIIKGIIISSDGESLDVAGMLDKINERIEYLYDREHTIGHAFFTGLIEKPTLSELAEVFRTKVVPLLQEYFYEDYEKIQLVLGDNDKSSNGYKFILDSKADERSIFKGVPDLDLKERKYSIQNDAFYRIQSYIEISETRKGTGIEEAD